MESIPRTMKCQTLSRTKSSSGTAETDNPVSAVKSSSKQNTQYFSVVNADYFGRRGGCLDANKSKKGFNRVVSIHVGEWCIFWRRWAAELWDWSLHDWSQVLFRDEYRFPLKCAKPRVLVFKIKALETTHRRSCEVDWWYQVEHV